MNVFVRPVFAVAFGGLILCAETCLHFESISTAAWLDMPWHDWIAAGWLLAAGLRGQSSRPALALTGAWAFMLSLLVAAFFGHLAEWWRPSPTAHSEWLSEGTVLVWLIALTVTAACAVTGLLQARQPPPR
jgi:hypothetical protein